MRQVGEYVERYGGEASLLVGVEHYTQEVSTTRVTRDHSRGRVNDATVTGVAQVPGPKRRLVSEFALVPNASASGGWLGYRDVMEVDGKPVADRHDRLQALFRSETPDLEAARRIADESARYNIGPVLEKLQRSDRHAVLLPFRQPVAVRVPPQGDRAYRGTRHGGSRVPRNADPDADHERGRQGCPGVGNALGESRGRRGRADAARARPLPRRGSHAEIVVTYQKDAAVGMWVPSRMEEKYSGGASGATTVATYKDFKRFQTSAKIK